MEKTLWDRIKSLRPKIVEIIRPNRNPHPWAKHGPKISGKAGRKTGLKKSQNTGYTNHERVMIGRAARMKITLTEYKARCAIFQLSDNAKAFSAKWSKKAVNTEHSAALPKPEIFPNPEALAA